MKVRKAIGRSAPIRPKALASAIRWLIASGLVLGGRPSVSLAAGHGGLPISVNQALEAQLHIPDLTSPALHPGVDVGRASGSFSPDGSRLTITQTTDRAILDWQRFDIDAGHAVQFQQPGSTSVALNNIHQSDPSRIYGSLTANGQVYFINQNGFLFGPDSQVNVNTLVASSLRISDQVFQQGITKAINSSTSVQDPTAALEGNGQTLRVGAGGTAEKIQILVEPGAKISGNQGRIILAAPSVTNEGSIEARDGQVILAAAKDKVYLQEATPGSDLRGILVEVKTGGDLSNLGKIMAQRGNATLIGFALRQQGQVSATTSATLNGSVRLLAREGAKLESNGAVNILKPTRTVRGNDLGDGLGTRATLTLGNGSLTSVSLDTSSATAVDEQTQPRSRIDLEGGAITLKTGSVVRAPGGTVNLVASESPATPLASTSAKNGSRILLESGSLIDVSGTRDTVLPMDRNVVSVELRNYELRDAPIQKHGPLHGQTIRVDIRKGTPLADISGAVARIQRSVSERNAKGGTVNLSSEGSVIVNPGAKVDIAGGIIRYLDGYLNTSHLLSKGKLYDVAEADPNRSYQAIFGTFSKFYRRWGITETWNIPGPLGRGSWERGYVDGQNAGSLAVKARETLFNGDLIATTVDGPYQRDAAHRPKGGTLSIDTAWSGLPQQDVLFDDTANLQTVADGQAFPESPLGNAVLNLGNRLFELGARYLQVDSLGKISLPASSRVEVPLGGGISLSGGELDIQGSIHAPSGTVSLKTRLPSGGSQNLSGDIRLGAAARIDSSGRWTNDLPASVDPWTAGPANVDGGHINILAQGRLLLDAGSRLISNGGIWLKKNAAVVNGRGGDISLAVAGPRGTELSLGAQIQSYGADQGGVLSISAPAIRIGGDPASGANAPLVLQSELFDRHGFRAVNLTATAGDLEVAAGTTLRPRMLNLQITDRLQSLPTGSNLDAVAHLQTLPDFQRKPVDLSLAVKHAGDGLGYSGKHAVIIGQGTAILGDAGAKFTLASDGNLRVNGTLSAPSGRIDLSLNPAPASLDPGYLPDQSIGLGPLARLDARGITLLVPNTAKLRFGEVRPGGTVSLAAQRGSLLMDPGAGIDVSGDDAVLDIFQPGLSAGLRSGSYVPRLIGSAGGKISLSAAETLVAAGRLAGRAGAGPGAAGGRLEISLDASGRGEPEGGGGFPTGPRTLHVSATGSSLLDSDNPWNGPIPAEWNGQGYIGASQVAEGGFSSLKLATPLIIPDVPAAHPTLPERASIQFDGTMDLHLASQLRLDTPVLAWAPDDSGNPGTVSLAASTVSLGSSFNRQGHDQVVEGAGSLSVHGNLIDLLGSSELQGFSKAELGSSGDIRLIGLNPNGEGNLLGNFAMAGALSLNAQQTYPTTLSQFSLQVLDTADGPGTVSILPGRSIGETPLSAGGKLGIEASRIDSRGVLRAPLGQIELNGRDSVTLEAGSLTSVSGRGVLIPFGRTQAGLDWIFPLNGYQNVQAGVPEKSVRIQAGAIHLNSGAKVDISGGGDLSAFEFIPGQGGSADVLDPRDPSYASGKLTYTEKYAVLPGLKNRFAPYDPLEFPSSGLSAGDSVYLSGGGGLAAGRYVLLPAHYALLPGAYLVTPEAGTTDLAAGAQTQRLDGAPIVAGYRLTQGTGERDTRWSGFTVEPGSIAKTRSEYQINRASQFFPAQAAARETPLPPVTGDAGTLGLNAGRSLVLAGQVLAEAVGGGRGGRLDISADRLAIVPRRDPFATGPAGTVELDAGELNRLKVDSILIGGHRTVESGATRLSADAASVTLEAGSLLQGPEILLAARDRIDLLGGTQIAAVGKLSRPSDTLLIGDAANPGEGALVRVSSGPQSAVLRDLSAGPAATGDLNVATGAVLSSSGSIWLDASRDNVFQGDIRMSRGQLGLAAGRISLGDAPAGTGGLVLSEGLLNRLTVDELSLNSYAGIDLYGSLGLKASNLNLQGAGLYGYGHAGQQAGISAGRISLSNPEGATTTDTATGAGELLLSAKTLELGPGAYALSGFSGVDIRAGDGVLGKGRSDIRVDSDVRLAAGEISGAAGADTRLDLGGFNFTGFGADGGSPLAAGLGAHFSLSAGNIFQQGAIRLPSGFVTLSATGGLNLASGALIDVGGSAVKLGSLSAYAPGGQIELCSENGDLNLAAGSRLSVSAAAGGGDAGSLSLTARSGQALLAGGFEGRAGQGGAGGSFNLDAGALSGSFSRLNAVLQSGGFTQSIAVRQHTGELLIPFGATVLAHEVQLSTDDGDLRVDGTIDAKGPSAGQVQLAAGDRLILGSNSRIDAGATLPGQAGGKLSLDSVDADGDGVFGVIAAAGSRIDVSGGAGGSGGQVAVRAGRIGGDDVGVDLAGATIVGASDLNLEAVTTYRDTSLSNARITQWRDDLNAFMGAAAGNTSLQARLGGFRLSPGLEIRNSGDLNLDLTETLGTRTWTPYDFGINIWVTRMDDLAGAVGLLQQISPSGGIRQLQAAASPVLDKEGSYYFDADPASPTFRQLFVRVFPDNAQAGANRYKPSAIRDGLVEHNGWDFQFPSAGGESWRFGPEQTPGILSLQTAGKLSVAQNLSDGVALVRGDQFGTLDALSLQPGRSWSYRLVAGADLNAAAALSLGPDRQGKDLVIGSGAAVRTGTGSIDMAAGGDIRLSDATSAVYTAGRPADTERFGTFRNATAGQDFYAEYPVEGGAISLSAGGDIIGAASSQFMSDWLVRTGNWNPSDGIGRGERPTAWGIALDSPVGSNGGQSIRRGFRENIGTLGGGNITVKAGGDVRDLSLMLPTTGKPVGQVVNGKYAENRWLIQGGGDLSVRAGGNIAGGVFFVDRGSADIRASGAITGGSQYTSGPIFALGDGQVSVSAGGNIDVGTVLNPFAIKAPEYTDKNAYFTTYTANSAIGFTSLAGDIKLNNDTAPITNTYQALLGNNTTESPVLQGGGVKFDALLALYPGSLRATALSGNLHIPNSFELYPAARGQLDLFASQDIILGRSDQDLTVNQLDVDPASLLSPAAASSTPAGAIARLFATPPTDGDIAKIHAAIPVHAGDTVPNRIVAASGDIRFLKTPTLALAKPLQLAAGRDLVNPGLQVQNLSADDVTSISAGRDIVYPLLREPTRGDIVSLDFGIDVAGPGLLQVSAGRHVDLGTSTGIVTSGGLHNPALPSTGAGIDLLAGINGGVDTAGFIRRYMLDGAYQDRLPLLASQTREQQINTLLDILFTEIRASAKAAATLKGPQQAAAYQRGYTAIETLFPGSSHSGDIKLFFSKVQTVEGGNINLLAPGGSANIGLATAVTGGKSAADLGVVVQREGNINALVRDDFQVNLQRVFTLNGGDITVWSSLGDIDAGRGAKSAIAAPNPIISFDARGNLVVEFPPTTSGSGIRAQSGFNSDKIGNVVLAAPKGIVDASEAGIGGDQITIAATAVVGASNIQAQGSLTGVPQAAAVVMPPATAGNALAGSAKSAESMDTLEESQKLAAARPVKLSSETSLNAQVVGFGNCSVGDVRSGKAGCN